MALRAKANRVVARAVTLSLVPLVYAVLALTVIKVTRGAPTVAHALTWGFALPLAVFAGGVMHAALRKAAPHAGSLALDRVYELKDRITNALAFSALPSGERTPLMEAAIEDALATSRELSPRRAAPLTRPKDLWVMFALVAGVAGLALLEVPVKRVVPKLTHHVDAIAITDDDADLFRRISEDLQNQSTDPAAAAGARKFNQLVEDLAERRLDRREVFRRLDELERSLKDASSIDASALDEALDGVAKELAKSGLARGVSQALAEKRLADAEQAMKDLAKKIESAKKDVDKAKLEELRKALQKSSETVHSKAAEQDGARKDLEERRRRLLQKKQKEGLTKAEQQELEQTERKLERLDREKAHSDAQQKAMSELDRDLAKAAQDLMKDLGMGSQDLKKGAEDINRAANQRMSEQQKEELKRRIEELRQLLRQEGQSGRDRIKRMMAFGNQARGQQGQGQGGGQQGQGQGQNQGQGQGQGKKQLTFGQGQGQGEGQGIALGPTGVAPAAGENGQSQGSATGSGDKDTWGTGHDPNLAGDATKLKGQTEDVTAAGADTGQGAASSQVIYGAAERGFVGRGYKKVFTDYQTVAEESLSKDEIPPGYRFYVRRYFQLIRPRD
ncbi:MAG TPA: hypothetical protein VHC69_05575 [Polyangiaceae bacterium]|nr:hypothetical protein [Polyangiaceae bacterium]